MTQEIDLLLGETRLLGLNAGETQRVTINASGQMRFVRDLVYAFVDSSSEIVETDENNNLLFARCATPTATP